MDLDLRSEFLCQSSRSRRTYRSPQNHLYAWDISHALITLYHPYAHEPSALTEYLKQKLRVQQAKHRGHSHLTQVKSSIPLEHNTAHTSHCLQPLDVGVFSPLQCTWQKCCAIAMDDSGEGISRQQVVREYMTACTKSFKESMILSAWKKSRILPFNPGTFTSEDFGLAFLCHLRPSYPSHFQCNLMTTTWTHQMIISVWMTAQSLSGRTKRVTHQKKWGTVQIVLIWVALANCPFWLRQLTLPLLCFHHLPMPQH